MDERREIFRVDINQHGSQATSADDDEDEEDEEILLYHLLLRRRRIQLRAANRKTWVKSWVSRRQAQGWGGGGRGCKYCLLIALRRSRKV